MRALLALCIALSLANCATLTKKECVAGNWDEIGFRDGTNGRTSDFIQQHAKACEKTETVPNQSVWEAGRKRGLPVYCVPAKAYSEGKKGRSLSAVCPAAQMPALQYAHANGAEYYEYTAEIEEIQSRINAIDSSLVVEQDAGKRAMLVHKSRILENRIRLLELRRSLVATF